MAHPRKAVPRGTSRPAPRAPRRTPTTGSSPLDKIPTKYHTPLFIAFILLTIIVFFGGVIFGGKTFAASDAISWQSFVPYLEEVSRRGEHPFWIPYIFSGMPAFGAYLVTGDRWWDLSMTLVNVSEHIFSAIGKDYYATRVIFHYFIYGLGMYLLMRSKKAARSTAALVAVGAIFSTWIIVYVMIGHNTKIMVLMTFPFIFMCLEQLIRRWSFLYAGLLILAVHVMMEANHPQTAFYGACAVGVYLLFEFFGNLIGRESKMAGGVLRAGAILVVAGAMAYGMGIDRYSAIAEYTPYSTRGAAPLKTDPTKADQETEDGGHGYKYATDWSFSPEETITFLVPSYFGFGKVKYDRGGGETTTESTYWGQMPFTDAAHYMGMAILILGLFGAWMNRSNRFVQALLVVGIFGLLLSFGRNGIPFLYDFFYYNVPSFNKFRAPSQSLVLLEFIFPILAGFGLETLIAMRKSGENPKADKTILYALIGFVAIMVIGLIGLNVSKASYMTAIAAAAKSPDYPKDLTPAGDFIFSMVQSDWLFSILFGGAVLLLMYLFVRSKINATLFKILLALIILWDLWRVDTRPYETYDREQAYSIFERTDIDEFLDKDTTAYRIMDVSISPNYAARGFHEHILGYHAAKMRSYQNLLDYTGQGNVPETRLAWDMLNTKYIIAQGLIDASMKPVLQSQSRQGIVVSENPHALPRAWFVNRVDVAPDTAVLAMIGDTTYRTTGKLAFDPRDVAWVTARLTTPIDPVGYSPASTTIVDSASVIDTTSKGAGTLAKGSVTITRHQAHHITIDVDAPGPSNNFLVVSEVHYPPAWVATIDGKPAEIIQTNYLLRGLVVPAGKHTIDMTYVREGFATHKVISLALNVLMLGMIGYGAWSYRRRPEESDPAHDAEEIQEEDA